MSKLSETLFSRLFWNVPGHFERHGMLRMLSHGWYEERFRLLHQDSNAPSDSWFRCTYTSIGRHHNNGLYRIESKIIIAHSWQEVVLLDKSCEHSMEPLIKVSYKQKQTGSRQFWLPVKRIPQHVLARIDDKSDKDILECSCCGKWIRE